MKPINKRYYSIAWQCVISVFLVLLVSTICYYSVEYIGGYKVVALILMLVVSFVAMVFEILPVLIAAITSAIVWNFFFIPPVFTFHITSAEDGLMFSMYFIIAMVNAVLTIKIRKTESKLRDKEEKENTIKLYNNLLNSLSHELRTPIATIIGAVDTLQENRDQLSESNRNELFNQIDEASMRLNRQVENLLNMSRLESGMLRLKSDWCDLDELINSLIRKDFRQFKHRIVFHAFIGMPLVKIDVGLMEQVLHNLIHNAVQYAPDHSQISIRAMYKENICMIEVCDQGKGFPDNEMENVFQKFYRLPQSKAGGSGLGLSIAKGFVEAHHGTLTLENIPSGGAKFTIRLPVESSFINKLKNE